MARQWWREAKPRARNTVTLSTFADVPGNAAYGSRSESSSRSVGRLRVRQWVAHSRLNPPRAGTRRPPRGRPRSSSRSALVSGRDPGECVSIRLFEGRTEPFG